MLNPDPTDLSSGRGRQIWRLFIGPAFDLLKNQFRERYAEHRLTAAQACMVQGLTEPMSQREAALQLGYDPSNITALADALEAKGLVERRPDPTDRRVKTLARTAEGERIARDLDASLSSPPEVLSRLSPQEEEQLLGLLEKVFRPSA